MTMIGGNLGTLWIWHSMRARDDREIGVSGFQGGKGTLESEFGIVGRSLSQIKE